MDKSLPEKSADFSHFFLRNEAQTENHDCWEHSGELTGKCAGMAIPFPSLYDASIASGISGV